MFFQNSSQVFSCIQIWWWTWPLTVVEEINVVAFQKLLSDRILKIEKNWIWKNHVEDRILKIPSMERNSVETLNTIISEELIKIKEEPEIFANLLKSYPARLDAVRKNHGGHTDYLLG